MYPIQGQSFSVLGLARSGLAAANYLARHGASVQVSDRSPAQKLPLDKLHPAVSVVAGEEHVRPGDTVIISPGIKPDSPAHKLAHELGKEVISDIELFGRLAPCPIIAITGTDGKSTSTALIGALCEAAGFHTFVGGNIGVACMEGLEQLTPQSVAVLEVSCFQLTHCYDFKPKVALVTNIAEDHVEYHGSMEEYIKAKQRVYQSMGAGDVLVLNGDDPELARWSTPEGVTVRRFSWKPGADGWSNRHDLFLRRNGEDRLLVRADELKLLGLHNIENVLGAVLAVDGTVADMFTLLPALKQFAGLEHRMEFVLTHNGVSFYNDSKATNPHAAMAVVNSFHDRFVLLAGGYEKGSDFSDFGKLVAEKTKAAILYGVTAKRIAESIPAGHKVILVETLQQAIAEAMKVASPGEKVILAPACASYDQFSDFEDRGRKFKQWVRELAQNGEGFHERGN